MAVRDHTGSIALCASLLLHGVISYCLMEGATVELGRQRYWSALPAPSGVVRSPIFIDEPAPPAVIPEPAKPEPKPPEPQPPAPPPSPVVPKMADAAPDLKPLPIPKPELAPDPGMARPVPVDGFGEMTGDVNATSLHSLSGDKPMQAPRAEQDQPLIRREPSMRSGDPDGAKATEEPPAEKPPEMVAAEPAQPRPPEAKPLPSPERPKPAPAPETPPAPFPAPSPRSVQAALLLPGPGSDMSLPGMVPVTPALPQKPVEIASVLPLPLKDPSSAMAAPVRPPAKIPSGPTAKTSQAPAGDVAPQSDSDSDAFTMTGSAEFRPGKVVARFGRAVKTVRPTLSLAGRNDLLSLMDSSVELEVTADETGAVRKVRIIHSSGSNEIDQPCELAMYQWWFEPPRDSAGRPHASKMMWTLHFTVR